jgi:rhodanese-related sulfurtransferase
MRMPWFFFGGLVLIGGAVAGLSLRQGPDRRAVVEIDLRARPQVRATDLASWIVEGRRDFVVVDLRPADDYKKGHVKGAVSCSSCHASAQEGAASQRGETFVDLTKKLVLVTDGREPQVALPKILANNPRVSELAGGYPTWEQQILAKVTFGGEIDERQIELKRKREALRRYFSGERPSAAPARIPITPVRREGAHKPAVAREGC